MDGWTVTRAVRCLAAALLAALHGNDASVGRPQSADLSCLKAAAKLAGRHACFAASQLWASTCVRRTSAWAMKGAAKLRQRMPKPRPCFRGCRSLPSANLGESQPCMSTCGMRAGSQQVLHRAGELAQSTSLSSCAGSQASERTHMTKLSSHKADKAGSCSTLPTMVTSVSLLSSPCV